MLDFDSFDYFEDLLALLIVLAPVFYVGRRPTLRCLLLGASGLYLVALIAPRLAAFYFVFWLLQFGLQRLVRRWPHEPTAWVGLTLSIVLTLAPMVTWKILPTDFIIEFNLVFNSLVDDTSSWFGAIDRARDIILPIGLSFATFRAVDVLVKIHLELADPLRPTRLFAFGFFPPVQVIGPVIEVHEVVPKLEESPPAEASKILSGSMLIALGMVKVFGIALLLEPSSIVLSPLAQGSTTDFWLELFRFALFFYFNFSGFSDIAVGAGLILGFELQPNFDNPYLKTNPQDFWNSWHMSLTKFCQRNVFVPLGGMRPGRQYPAIMATIMVIALWHDITLSLVVFGLYHGTGLVAHRMLSNRRPPSESLAVRLFKIAAHYVYFSLSLPMLLLSLSDLPDFYANLFGGAA